MEVRLNIYRDWLREYLLPHWPRVLGLAVLLFGAIGFQIVNPQIMRVFIDSAIGGKPQKVLIFAALLFMGAALLHQVFSLFATYVSAKLGWTTTNLLRERLARHCLNQDLSFHHIHSPGELIERIDGDVSNLADFFSQFVVQILGNLLLLCRHSDCALPGGSTSRLCPYCFRHDSPRCSPQNAQLRHCLLEEGA